VDQLLTIGEVSERSGLAASAVRFYERRGLVHAERTASGQRRFRRDVLRRIAFIRIAQRVGLSLEEISAALTVLPADRAPSRADWRRLTTGWQERPLPPHLRAGQSGRRGRRRGSRAPVAHGRVSRPGWVRTAPTGRPGATVRT
jgi:DNA-binding transcriptional MerR regulator